MSYSAMTRIYFQFRSRITNKTEPAIAKTSANQDDVFSVGKAKEERKTKTAEPLVAKDSAPSLLSTKAAGDGIVSSINDKTSEEKLVPSSDKPPSKPAESPKISSPLDNDDLFSTDKSVAKTTGAKASKTEAKLPVKEQAPVLDDESFSSSSVKNEIKPEKKENQKVTADKKISSPLGDDDDLFAVSTPAKKDINKSVTDSVTKKTASPQTNKKTTPKSSTILDDDDDELFSVKKRNPESRRESSNPWEMTTCFGDSGDIFSDIPSKPKGAKKKKSATTAPKDDIFAGDAAAGGDEQTTEKAPKKTVTKAKKKTEKKPKASIFDDDVPSIFDDPLNATSK
ncbi:hypothetical protein OS493_010354 [Desmophyllum pertusum]|uniref:FAM21/CAPZIP domain-containing protein n=1 Tax=Desmophyllum pertusum TaxID=174260 RepID=A0A9X0A3D8_9CNID|nr:hypothetical protein OS493_010354 [Desmophyllum pertusum]